MSLLLCATFIFFTLCFSSLSREIITTFFLLKNSFLSATVDFRGQCGFERGSLGGDQLFFFGLFNCQLCTNVTRPKKDDNELVRRGCPVVGFFILLKRNLGTPIGILHPIFIKITAKKPPTTLKKSTLSQKKSLPQKKLPTSRENSPIF